MVMTRQPSLYRLVPDKLNILMATKAHRHHKEPRFAEFAAVLIQYQWTCAKVNLTGLTRFKV